jgi:ATP-dependent DNA helicase DinG
LLEVQVHHILRQIMRDRVSTDMGGVRAAYLQENRLIGSWPHQLTMARLVARALRLQQSTIIQTGLQPHGTHQANYASSYLVPALLWPGSVAIIATTDIRQRLIESDIPQLQAQLGSSKAIHQQPSNISSHSLLLISPEQWLANYRNLALPILVDGADQLEQWINDWQQVQITPQDWDALVLAAPQQAEKIRDQRVRLTKSIFQRPVNPYNCYLLTSKERQLIPSALTQQISDDWLVWAKIDRSQGLFTLFASQIELDTNLAQLWARSSHILIGNVLDIDHAATGYRQELGFGEITCVKFAASKRSLPQLYVPNWMPMPNTKKFQEIFSASTMRLLAQRLRQDAAPRAVGLIVIVVGDTPLKAQIAAQVAAEYGSRVQVENPNLLASSILVTGWEFWNDYQALLPSPQLLIIATLPIPSLEDPLVAAKVSCYKRQRQDWFRNYLLPAGLRVLQRSISAIRQSAGLVVIFDNRINHRSYGKQVLAALHPIHRIDTPQLR